MSHFTDKAQVGKVTYQKSHSQKASEADLKTRQTDSSMHAPNYPRGYQKLLYFVDAW